MDRQTETDIYIYKRLSHKQNIYIYIYRQTDIHTDRQTDRQTDGRTDMGNPTDAIASNKERRIDMLRLPYCVIIMFINVVLKR